MAKTVLLLNMGGATSPEEIKVFLSNMFNDGNILPIKSRLLRRGLAWLITHRRHKHSQEIYKKIGGKSPILDLSLSLRDKLSRKSDMKFFVIMRYTEPRMQTNIDKILDAGDEIILLPLYPQYSFATSKSSIDEAVSFLENKALFRVIKDFHANDAYIDLLINNVLKLGIKNVSGFDLILSAHSLPLSNIKKGDPYLDQCLEMKVKIVKKLRARGINFKSVHLAFQSKFGRKKWLEPSLKNTIANLGSKNLVLLPISFTIDNLETLYELKIEYGEYAKSLGAENFQVASCPNDSDEFVTFLLKLIEQTS